MILGKDLSSWQPVKPFGHREEEADCLQQLFWTVQPPLGMIKGDYYKEEALFHPHFPLDPGYKGILEVVKNEGKIVHVEFNEYCSPSTYIRTFQGVSKRRSAFAFFQATKIRTAQTGAVINNGITHVEEQMLRENRLVGDFDLVTGASNSVTRSLLPLAKKINATCDTPSGKRYYGFAERMPNGITPRLQLVVSGYRIIDCFYDEIFADTPEEIEDEALKKYYRQSKYFCLNYESDFYDGFNAIFDLLCKRVIITQNLLDLSGLPGVKDSKNNKRNPEWDNYLRLAGMIKDEMSADGIKI